MIYYIILGLPSEVTPVQATVAAIHILRKSLHNSFSMYLSRTIHSVLIKEGVLIQVVSRGRGAAKTMYAEIWGGGEDL